ncbi:MAG: hypothetical protein WCV86_01805 [Patescibacteria group bacterium]|jgi:hypothetical protein
MALRERLTPQRRPTYSSRVNIKDVKALAERSVKHLYGNRKLTNEEWRQYVRENPELQSEVFRRIGLGHNYGSGTIEGARAKRIIKVIGETVRNSQKTAVASRAKKDLFQAKKLEQQAAHIEQEAQQMEAPTMAARKLREAEKLQSEAAELHSAAEQEQAKMKVRMSLEAREETFKKPKATLSSLRKMRVNELTPKGPSKADIAQKENTLALRRRMRLYDNTRDAIYARFGKKGGGVTSINDNDNEIVDFHKEARTTSTDYQSIPTSVSEVAKNAHAPLASASEVQKEVAEDAPNPGVGGENEDENTLDDDLPLAA